jgi:hypothetical protein
MDKVLGTTRFHLPVPAEDVRSSKKISLLKNSLKLQHCASSPKYITAVTGMKGNERLGHWLASRNEEKIIVEFDFYRTEEKFPSIAAEVKKNREMSFFKLKWVHLEQMTKAQKMQLSAWLEQFVDCKSDDPKEILKNHPGLAEKILDHFPAVNGVIFQSDVFLVGVLRADATRIAQAHVVHDVDVKVGI